MRDKQGKKNQKKKPMLLLFCFFLAMCCKTYFCGVPYLATFIFNFSSYQIAYIHPVYSTGVCTHDILVMSRLP